MSATSWLVVEDLEVVALKNRRANARIASGVWVKFEAWARLACRWTMARL
jgi:hypothetical protein